MESCKDGFRHLYVRHWIWREGDLCLSLYNASKLINVLLAFIYMHIKFV